MRFSLKTMGVGLSSTLKRFPFVIISAVIWTVLGLLLLHNDHISWLVKSFTTATLAFPLLVAASTLSEKRTTRTVALTSSSIFLVVFLFFFSKDLVNNNQLANHFQYILWVIAAITLIPVAPFIKKAKQTTLNFWHYNQRVLYAFITTFIFSATIFAGLSIALASVNFLFNLHLAEERWVELWITIVGLFSSTFFLSRFPKPETKSEPFTYPKELRIFGGYILSPLVAIYFLILYTYTAKILISGQWPDGTIAWMILGFSTLGIATYAILYPLIQEKKLKKLSTIFFSALIPQVFVLFWAVWIRVSDYGITEKRYLLVVFGAWIFAISLYFLISKVKNLKTIPASLFVLLLTISFGPWGMRSVSENSQISRLKKLVTSPHDEENKNEIRQIVDYLYEFHGLKKLEPLYLREANFELAECKQTRPCPTPDVSVYRLGIDNNPYENRTYTSIKHNHHTNLPVKGYDYIINDPDSIDIEGDRYSFKIDSQNTEYMVYKNNSLLTKIPLKEFIQKLDQSGKNEFTPEELSLAFEDNRIKVKIYFSFIQPIANDLMVNETIVATFK